MKLVRCKGSVATAALLAGILLAGTLPQGARGQVRPTAPSSAREPELAILDTDIGDDIDEVFALGIALASPELNVLGVTSAWGDTALRSQMLDRLLCETGREDVPVFTGISTVARHQVGAAAFSQAAWARAGLQREHGDAVGFLLGQARAHPGSITLIAIAPLTNIGAAIDRDPAGFRQFKRVVLMGGSVNRGYGPAGSKASAEYNIAMDPEAARKLFRSGVPVFMMPLDSTQIAFGGSRMDSLVKISTPLTDAIQVLTDEYKLGTGWPAPTLFDPVAVAYAIDPRTCPATPMHIEVDDKGFTRAVPGEPNAQVCLEEHPEAFYSLIMPRLLEQRMVGTRVCVKK
jgi:inosine-uridine nucleoside N-ribohydrolase